MVNLVLSLFFEKPMALIFSSMIPLQILAHLPLAGVNVPANTFQTFDIMIEVVSFDFYPLTDHHEFGFTPTDPWSEAFENLSYETVNFIQNMNSLMLFVWAYEIYIMMVVLFNLVKK